MEWLCGIWYNELRTFTYAGGMQLVTGLTVVRFSATICIVRSYTETKTRCEGRKRLEVLQRVGNRASESDNLSAFGTRMST